jgi:hypothetical protein
VRVSDGVATIYLTPKDFTYVPDLTAYAASVVIEGCPLTVTRGSGDVG